MNTGQSNFELNMAYMLVLITGMSLLQLLYNYFLQLCWCAWVMNEN